MLAYPCCDRAYTLFSLTLYEVKYIPLLKISGVPTLLTLSIRNVTPSNHTIQCSIRNVQFLLDLLRAHHRVKHIWDDVAQSIQIIITHSASGDLLSISLLLVSFKASITQRLQSCSEYLIIQYLSHNHAQILRPNLVRLINKSTKEYR